MGRRRTTFRCGLHVRISQSCAKRAPSCKSFLQKIFARRTRRPPRAALAVAAPACLHAGSRATAMRPLAMQRASVARHAQRESRTRNCPCSCAARPRRAPTRVCPPRAAAQLESASPPSSAACRASAPRNTRTLVRRRGHAPPPQTRVATPRPPSHTLVCTPTLPPRGPSAQPHCRAPTRHLCAPSGAQTLPSRCPRALLPAHSRWWDLNPQPRLYESRALPLSYIGVGHAAKSRSRSLQTRTSRIKARPRFAAAG